MSKEHLTLSITFRIHHFVYICLYIFVYIYLFILYIPAGKSTSNVLRTHAWSSCFDSQSLDRCTVQRWSEACAEILRLMESNCENTWNIWWVHDGSRNMVMPVQLKDSMKFNLSMPQTSKTSAQSRKIPHDPHVTVCSTISTCSSINGLLYPMKFASTNPAIAHFSPGNIAWGPGLSVLSKRLVLWTEKNISGTPSGYHLHSKNIRPMCHALTTPWVSTCPCTS